MIHLLELEGLRSWRARPAVLVVCSSLALVSPSAAYALELTPLPPLPERPAALEPVARQCPASVALVPGRPVPAELVDEAGLVVCSAVAVPTSEALDLVALEAWSAALGARYRLDTSALLRDRSWLGARLDELEEPPRWYATPAASRWGGRLEILVTVAALGGLLAGSERLAGR